MLVSSIGYFTVSKTVVPNNIVKNQTNKVSLSEGFGYSNDKIQNSNGSSLVKNFVDSFKSMFVKKSDESTKYLSLIA